MTVLVSVDVVSSRLLVQFLLLVQLMRSVLQRFQLPLLPLFLYFLYSSTYRQCINLTRFVLSFKHWLADCHQLDGDYPDVWSRVLRVTCACVLSLDICVYVLRMGILYSLGLLQVHA